MGLSMLQEYCVSESGEKCCQDQPGLINSTRALLVVLLKWQLEADFRNQELTHRIRDHRRTLNRMLRRSPALRLMQARILENLYLEAKECVCKLVGLPANHFPERCPYSLDDVLSPFFFPRAE